MFDQHINCHSCTVDVFNRFPLFSNTVMVASLCTALSVQQIPVLTNLKVILTFSLPQPPPLCRFWIRELLPARGASGHVVRQPSLCCSRSLRGPTVRRSTARHLGKMSDCIKKTIAPRSLESCFPNVMKCALNLHLDPFSLP